MRVDLSDVEPELRCTVPEYLGAELRARFGGYSGAGRHLGDGDYSVTLDTVGEYTSSSMAVSWSFIRDRAGSVAALEVTPKDVLKDESAFASAVSGVVDAVKRRVRLQETSEYFHRETYYYQGVRLDGEYWLSGVRLGPACPPDAPEIGNLERAVHIDQHVRAIDATHARQIGHTTARRNAARLSLLLNVGLYEAADYQQWFLNPHYPPRSVRSPRGFLDGRTHAREMPQPGVDARSGQLRGTILTSDMNPLRNAQGLLVLPCESATLLSALGDAPEDTVQAFDGSARLFQVALAVGDRFPTAQTAYHVASVEALSKRLKISSSFSGVMRKYLKRSDELKELLNLLYGTVRSGHFHSATFPLGDYEGRFGDLTVAGSFEGARVRSLAHGMTRYVIMRWAHETLLPSR